MIASNFKADIVDRVSAFEDWLSTGDCPGLIEAMDSVQSSFKAAIVSSTIVSDGTIATVESTHRGATELAYCYAPVAIIRNDVFRFPGVEGEHTKYTICQFTEGYVDLRAVSVDLNTLESGWGGSATIVGSPQGVSSNLTMRQVGDIVFRHLL